MILKHYVEGSLLYCHPPEGLNDRQEKIYDEDTLITQWNMERVRLKKEVEETSSDFGDSSSGINKEENGIEYGSSLELKKDMNLQEEEEVSSEFDSDVDLDTSTLSLEQMEIKEANINDMESLQLSNRKQKTKPQHLKKWGKKGRKLRNPEPYYENKSDVFGDTTVGAKISGHDKKKALYGKRGDGEYYRMKHINFTGREIDEDGYQFEG